VENKSIQVWEGMCEKGASLGGNEHNSLTELMNGNGGGGLLGGGF